MSKVTEKDCSDSDDGALYSINSDLSSIYSDLTEQDSEDSESDLFSEEVGDDSNIMDSKQQESWSGKMLKTNLPYYIGKLKLSNNFESKIPPNSSPIDFFCYITHQN